MRIWTVHLPRGEGQTAPVLVREGFSWGAFLLTLPWLLWHRLWLEAVAWLGLTLLIAALVPKPAALPIGLALQFLAGAHGRDLWRAALARRGRPVVDVVVAEDEDHALARLLTARPELARGLPA